MPQTSGRLFDELSRLITDAAGLAEGARREVETVVKAQLERLLAGMDVVTREEFEAAKEMAAKARNENEALAARIAALEAKLGGGQP
jgi:BMFP domain-containing protein YqiC